MFQIPKRGLFFNHTENPFLFCTYKQSAGAFFFLTKKRKELKYPYLEGRSLDHGGEFPSSQVPYLKSTAVAPLALPSPPAPASSQKDIYLHTDDINMPANPVGFNSHNVI
jgi:hypothetical protein